MSKDFTNDRERLEKLVIETQKQLDVIERKIQTGDNRRQLIEQYTNLELTRIKRNSASRLRPDASCVVYIVIGKTRVLNFFQRKIAGELMNDR